MKTTSTFLSGGMVRALVFGAGLFTVALVTSAQGTRFFRLTGPVPTTITAFRPDGTLVWTNAPTNTTFTVQTTTALGGISNWVDFVQLPVTNGVTTNRVTDFNPPSGMALIPAGTFTMGDGLDGDIYSLPLHTVYVSEFYMDKYEVTKALWDRVYQWAMTHGYGFSEAGSGKATEHPVQSVLWCDVVKWCNARSEMEGRMPAYYTSASQTVAYRIGLVDVQNDWVKWDAGYRLPTEAEWEKAARGGANGERFPWGNMITHSQANYYSTNAYTYDVSPTRGYHPTFDTDIFPFTSPVGSFAPNGYGIYDMAGNVWEWCWDRYDSYSSVLQTDPRGSTSNFGRVIRGGGYSNFAEYSRMAFRFHEFEIYGGDYLGFRSVMSPTQ